jgi:hypothetical protein
MYMCPILRGFQDRAIAHIKVCQDTRRRATRHVLTQVAECIDVHGIVFENMLY